MSLPINQPHVTRSEESRDIAWIGGSVHRVVLDGAATSDRLTLVRSTMRGGAGSPVHVHEHDDETVYLISGSGVFWAGHQRWELSSGDTAFLPRGLPHTYLFTSDTVEMLAICNPSGMEHFFEAAGWDLARPKPEDWAVDLDALRAAADATGQRILGPPLVANDVMPTAYLTGP